MSTTEETTNHSHHSKHSHTIEHDSIIDEAEEALFGPTPTPTPSHHSNKHTHTHEDDVKHTHHEPNNNNNNKGEEETKESKHEHSHDSPHSSHSHDSHSSSSRSPHHSDHHDSTPVHLHREEEPKHEHSHDSSHSSHSHEHTSSSHSHSSSHSEHTFDETLFGDTWNILDANDEKEMISVNNAIGDLSSIAKGIHDGERKIDVRKRSSSLTQEKPDGVVVEPKKPVNAKMIVGDDYKGPKVTFPISGHLVDEIREWFLGGHTLHYKYAHDILEAVLHIFKEIPTLQELKVPHSHEGHPGKIVVCGDTHGQMFDVFTIFRQNGLPSRHTHYLFNGDFVDRGPNGFEVLIFFYVLKLAYPRYFFFNRGNHEFRSLNVRYQFEEEVHKKYDNETFDLVQETFAQLPLCSLIEDKILVLHGGLWTYNDVTIDELRNLPKLKELPKHKDIKEDNRPVKIYECALWSDPKEMQGFKPSHRGAGVDFGVDITENFLNANNLDMIVRSHEMVNEGYSFSHNKKVVTLFSASYYCGTNQNKGAVMVFSLDEEKKLKYDFVQFYAEIVAHQEEVNRSCYHESLQKLRERIFVHRHELLLGFSKNDPNHTSTIPVDKWSDVLQEGLELKLKWSSLRPYIASVERNGEINYIKFLDRYKVAVDPTFMKRWNKHIVKEVCAKLHTAALDLTTAFKLLDVNNDGEVSYDEFVAGMKKYELGLSDEQLYELMRTIDTDESGSIDLIEFQDRFKMEFEKDLRGNFTPEEKEVMKKCLMEIAHKIAKGKELNEKQLKKAFVSNLSEGSKKLTFDELIEALQDYTEGYTYGQLLKLAEYIDDNKSGTISWKEFKNAFSFSDSHANEWVDKIIQQIGRVIHRHRSLLLSAFNRLDEENTGLVDERKFKSVLLALNELLLNPISDLQVKKLHRTLDDDDDGLINYKKFLDMFDVVDGEASV